MASAYKFFAQDTLGDKALTVVGAIGSVFNGSSRILWATLQDKFGFKKVYLCLMLLQLVTCSAIYFSKNNFFLYTVLVACSFLCEGGHFSMFPTVSAKVFGIKSGG